MIHFKLLLAAGAVAFASAATAQTYPTRGAAPVNDDAEIIADDVEARLNTRLTGLLTDTGAEMVVVTLPSSMLYTAGDDVADYADALFARWELGADGVLLLVFNEDRELHVATGGAYGADDNATTAAVIDELIVPQFREEDYGAGIEAGVEGLISRLVLAEAVETPVETPIVEDIPAPAEPTAPLAPQAPTEGSGGGIWWVVGILGAAVAGIVALVKRNAAKLAATPCSACGKTGLQRERVVLTEATEWQEGRGENRTTCPSCGHAAATPYTIPKLQPRNDAKDGKTAPGTGGHASSNGQMQPRADAKGARQPGTGGKDGTGGASGKW